MENERYKNSTYYDQNGSFKIYYSINFEHNLSNFIHTQTYQIIKNVLNLKSTLTVINVFILCVFKIITKDIFIILYYVSPFYIALQKSIYFL